MENRNPKANTMRAKTAAAVKVRLEPAFATPAPQMSAPIAMPACPRAILIRNFRKRACTIGRDLRENGDCVIKRQSPMQRTPRWRNCG